MNIEIILVKKLQTKIKSIFVTQTVLPSLSSHEPSMVKSITVSKGRKEKKTIQLSIIMHS